MRYGPYHVTREEVLEFARRFARPIESANEVEKIRISGSHTLSIYQRMQIDMHVESDSASALMAAVGMDEVRWLTPVYSGDVLEAEMEVLDKTESRSKPDRGILKARYTLYNPLGDAALTLISAMMMKRRPNVEMK
jgi:acyl dehydratase